MFNFRSLFVAIFILGGPSGTLIAEERSKFPETAGRLHIGSCVVDAQISAPEDLKAAGCFKSKAGSEVSHFFNHSSENYWAKFGSAYLGLHATSMFSIHLAGRALVVMPLGREASVNRNISSDLALIRLGNPAAHRLRISMGKLKLPFGIDSSEIPESIKWQENREFWASPRHGAYVSLDDKFATVIDLGYAREIRHFSEHISSQVQSQSDIESLKNHALALRISRDVSVLDGSRLTASFYGDANGQRRFGGAFITNTDQGDFTYFEFVRVLFLRSESFEPFRQMIRASYVSAWRFNSRWILQIDDERLFYRRGILGLDTRILTNLMLRAALAYKKSETSQTANRWSITTGLQAEL